MKKQAFLVEFNNGDHQFPMAWDESCKGALQCASNDEAIAMFPDRQSARKAIRISTKLARLRTEQGEPVNSDFLGKDLKHVHIRQLVMDLPAPTVWPTRCQG